MIAKKITLGMDRNQLLASCGHPTETEYVLDSEPGPEQWTYDDHPKSPVFYLVDGRVCKVGVYQGGFKFVDTYSW